MQEDIVDIHVRQAHKIQESALSVVDVEIGWAYVDAFCKLHQNDSRYIFVKMFDETIFGDAKYDVYFVHDSGGNLKKLVLFVLFPTSSASLSAVYLQHNSEQPPQNTSHATILLVHRLRSATLPMITQTTLTGANLEHLSTSKVSPIYLRSIGRNYLL